MIKIEENETGLSGGEEGRGVARVIKINNKIIFYYTRIKI